MTDLADRSPANDPAGEPADAGAVVSAPGSATGTHWLFERATRREGDEEKPLGPKAVRTREAILGAATALFSEQGYQRTTVGDVAARAGVSLGTVYQYFRDRQDIVSALIGRSVTAMLEDNKLGWKVDEGIEGLYAVVHAFVDHYVRHAMLSGVWEEVTHVDDGLAQVRRRLMRAFHRTVERELERGVEAGLLPGELDTDLAAIALAGMVDRYCYVTYVFDPPTDTQPTAERSATVLTRLWAAAVGLEVPR